MPSPSVSYSFANSTTADATQVNSNFTDLINGMTDGTKDFSINALTCGGAATLNGSVTLGNASSDDITVTGSLASTIPVKTTYSYDFASSTIGIRSIYLGSADSAARTTRLIGATVASSWTFTLPTAVGTIGQFLVDSTGGGVSAWRYPEKTTAKTTTYTGTGDETVILCDSSGGAFTVTLPAAASFTGKHYYIKKTSSDFSAVTIDGNASETIDGQTTTTINTQYEAIKIVSDGSNWHILDRNYPKVWTAFTMSVGASTSAPTKGTSGQDLAFWMRDGDSMEIKYNYYHTVAGTAGTGTYLYTIPNSLIIDTTKHPVSTSAIQGFCGQSETKFDPNNPYWGSVFAYNTTNLALYTGKDDTALTAVGSTHISYNNAVVLISFRAKVPISGWKG
jgi:hypothetical protein